jgi:hypothetical protein
VLIKAWDFKYKTVGWVLLLAQLPPNKDACMGSGWTHLTRGDGSPFKNQGDYMQFVNSGKLGVPPARCAVLCASHANNRNAGGRDALVGGHGFRSVA